MIQSKPSADRAGKGLLRMTIEGNDVTAALASSEEEAIKIERDNRAPGRDLVGRLERRIARSTSGRTSRRQPALAARW